MFSKNFFVLLVFFIPLSSQAINDETASGARSAAMGNASVALTDCWAIQNNQAALAYIKHPVAASYYQNRFLIKELGFQQGIFIYPTKFGTLGINASYFGYELYNESRIGLAYARQLGKRISAGLQLDYMNFNLGEVYGNKSVLTFELGALAHISNKVDVGLHIFNPAHVNLTEQYDEKIPAIIRLGVAYRLAEDLLTVAEVEKNIEYSPNFKAGLEYQLMDKAWIRAGVASNPSLVSFGFGLDMGSFSLDLASSYHSVLGFSPRISLIYNFEK